jgi:hypothetical protein
MLVSTAAAVAVLFTVADLNGMWLGYMLNRRGDKVDVSFKLTMDAAGKVSGKQYGDFRSSPVVEGLVRGNDVEFIVLATEQSGNEIHQSRLRFSGKFLNDNEIELNRERESVRAVGNSGNANTKGEPPPKQVVKLKRLL